MSNKEEVEEVAKGIALIERSDCESCHNEQLKTVGPAYIQIAQKYNDSDETVAMLAGKVIKGGAGVWGAAAMTAHPDLMEDDAKEMIRYILSLDNNLPGGSNAKYTLGEKSSPIKLPETFTPASGKGFAVHAYKTQFAERGTIHTRTRQIGCGVNEQRCHAEPDECFDQ